MNDQPSRAARTRYYMYPSLSVIAIEVCMRVVIGCLVFLLHQISRLGL